MKLLLFGGSAISLSLTSALAMKPLEGIVVPSISKQVPHQDAKWEAPRKLIIVSKQNSLVPIIDFLPPHHPVGVHTRFLPPRSKPKSISISSSKPLIGSRNITCYGGTAARYVRGD